MRTGRAPTAVAVAVALLASTPAGALADEDGEPVTAREATAAHGPVGLLLHIGVFDGFGAGLQLGTDVGGVRASVGWQPHVLLLQRPGQAYDVTLHGALLVSPDLYVRILHPRERTHVGLQAGYRHSSFLGHGGAAGFYVMFGVGAVDVHVAGGALFFPEGEDRARQELAAPGAKFAFPGPAVNVGTALGLAFFP